MIMVMVVLMTVSVRVVMMRVLVRMDVIVPRVRRHRLGTHCAAPSPFMRTLSNSESELRIAVVLSSRIFL
jgi:hypothetical protein